LATTEVKPKLKCEICGFETESKKGLAGHMRLAHAKPVLGDGVREYVQEAIKQAIQMYDSNLAKVIESYKRGIEAIQADLQKHHEALNMLDKALGVLDSRIKSLEIEISMMSNNVSRLCLAVFHGLKDVPKTFCPNKEHEEES
jgi:predicted RNase H-like nuclease (RuvC/YqgF family)